ncbi:MAG TPA: hypothetical protein VFE71_11995, partial [Bacteroidales bacterium]|nr:hypothetical protein [Bacteroidales bacterium]
MMDTATETVAFPMRHIVGGVTYYDVASYLKFGGDDLKLYLETKTGHKFRKSSKIPKELSDKYPGRLFVQHTQYYVY